MNEIIISEEVLIEGQHIVSESWNGNSQIFEAGSYEEDNDIPLLGRGSGWVRRSNPESSAGLLNLNIKSNTEYFTLTISLNYGSIIYQQEMDAKKQGSTWSENSEKQKRFEINLDALTEKANKKLVWNDIFQMAITLEPSRLEDSSLVELSKYLFDFQRQPIIKNHFVAPSNKQQIAFKTLQVVSLMPLLEREDEEFFDYNLDDNLFDYTDHLYSQSILEWENWNEHQYYQNIGKLYQFDEEPVLPSQNILDKFEVENFLINDSLESMLIYPENNLQSSRTFKKQIDKNNSIDYQVPQFEYLLKISEPTYYDFLAQKTLKGSNGMQGTTAGYQIPYNLDRNLDLKMHSNLSTIFNDVIINLTYPFSQPMLDRYEGSAQIFTEIFIEPTSNVQYDYEFKVSEDQFEDFVGLEKFNWNILKDEYADSPLN